jgi:hypothetical protein
MTNVGIVNNQSWATRRKRLFSEMRGFGGIW